LTVKRHTIELYRKLEVTGRRGAVARAAELGLFESGNQIGAAS
jgi:ATP/maltotriose-dependent transcriptional regulator MalT